MGRPSRISQIIESLQGPEKDWLTTALEDPRVTHRGLARELTQRGHPIDEASIRRHRDKSNQEDRMVRDRPAILIWDIESLPLLGYAWTIWDANILHVVSDWTLCTISWKWYGEDEVHVVQLNDFAGYDPDSPDESGLVELARDLLDRADYAVAWNGDRFDVRKVQGKMFEHGLTPPSPFVKIDPMKTAKKHFALTSNRMDSVAELVGTERKLQHAGFSMWLGCLAGDPAAFDQMRAYAAQDIVTLEALFENILPWETKLNFGLFIDDQMVCPNCGSGDLVQRGTHRTQVTSYRARRCGACGHYARERKAMRDMPSPALR